MYNFLIILLARILSTVFHPVILFLPLSYVISLHATDNISTAVRWAFFSWIFIFSLAVFVLYQVRLGNFTNFDISKREQRPKMFLFIGILILIYISCLLFLHGPVTMIIIAFSVLFGTFMLDLINKYVKASIHVAAVSSILFSFVILYGVTYVWILVLIPLVAWSRIKLHRHTVLETVIGAIFGIFLTVFVYAIIEYVTK